ncbi:hypothetical protein SUGI_0298710 [Cryptomeria japonica]|nr:hypothetical protein SUGI_0298710 [Cryptomeria japonica]
MDCSFEFQLNSCSETVYAEELFSNGQIRSLNRDNSFMGSESPGPCGSARIHTKTKNNSSDKHKIFQVHSESQNSMNLRNSSTEEFNYNIKKNRKKVEIKDGLARCDERKMKGKSVQVLESVNGYSANSRRVHCYKAQENRRKTFLPYISGLLGCNSLFQTVEDCHVTSVTKPKKAPNSVVGMNGF